MKQELDEALCAKYPKIFADRHAPMTETCMCWGFSCDDGWYRLIDGLCSCIQNYIDLNHKDDVGMQVVALQVKEKFGVLNFYYRGGNELVAGMVWFAEHLSGSICEVCGQPGLRRHGDWIRTLCDRHAAEAAASDAASNEELP